MNSIYSQAVVKWSVEPLNGMPTVDLGENGLDWADKSMLSSYNAEMNSVISAFKTWKPSADRDAYYLFIVPKFSEGSVEGFMPRNRSFGFITKEQIVDRTVAHELGHGVFNLKHTFSDWAITQGTTDNLMDYPSSVGQAAQCTRLWKPQWDMIHDPELTTGLFDDMADGASQISSDPVCVQRFLEQYRYAFVKQQKIIYAQDGYPFFGHFASKMRLLDGNTYEKIHVRISQDLNTVPIKLSSQLQGTTNFFSWGKIMTIYNNDNDEEFSKYLYPSNEEWNQQMNILAEQIGNATTINDALNLLAVMPLSEYTRLSPVAIGNSIALINNKFVMTEDYLSCINDEEIIIALVESCKNNFEKKKTLLLSLSKGNAMNRFLAHLDGDNLKKFVMSIASYTTDILPPNLSEITKDRFNSDGVIYSHLFDWQETLGQDIIFESDNAVLRGDFVISSKKDWLAIMQDDQFLMRIEPFEYIGLMADDVAQYVPKLVKPNETVVIIPAFLFHWLLNQKEREQTMKDFSTILDLGLSVATLGSYTAGKVITKVCVKTAEGMVIDWGTQVFINTLDGTSFENAIKQVDYKNVIWGGASANIDNTKLSLVFGCVRSASKGALSIDNNSIKEVMISAGSECFLDVFLSLVSKGIVKFGNKYFDIIQKKMEISPDFVTKRLLKYGVSKSFVFDLEENIVNSEIRQQIDKAVIDYEKGN